MNKGKKIEGLEKLSIPPSMRVVDPTDNRVCVHGPSCYATMCGLADDAFASDAREIIYGTRRAVTCQECVDAVLHASQFLKQES